jgi:hypothetical protein
LSVWKLCSRTIIKEGWIVRPPFRDALHWLRCLQSLSWHLCYASIYYVKHTHNLKPAFCISVYTVLLKIRYLIDPLLQGTTTLYSIMVWLQTNLHVQHRSLRHALYIFV